MKSQENNIKFPSFPKILNLESLGNSWGNYYV